MNTPASSRARTDHVGPDTGSVTIDCDSCVVRGPACGDCVVTVMLGAPPEGVHLDHDELDALNALSASGLVPPLRLVTALDEVVPETA